MRSSARRSVDELGVGLVSTGTTTVTLPEPLSAGSYFLFAKADAPEELLELSEFNNIRATTVAIGPDLVVTTLTRTGYCRRPAARWS